ncbi:protein FAM92A isoform X4 [Protopterus annectens]|uniref:protein FAM92A isoform X4 n=1 Tax=Protopterus annectens TaxID=7888 RepID=UPI001CFB042E|nr:protein FAM92A isoform X4 [Protopterus annectens]
MPSLGKLYRPFCDHVVRDNQAQQIQDAVSNVEKHFGLLCQLLAAYIRKTARLRDKADSLVKEISIYADTETPNLKRGLKSFAVELANIQDYRTAQDDIKAALLAWSRESKQMAQLEKTRQRNPSDRHIISQAESELQRATMDATRTSQQLEETIDNFERSKMKDIKKIFTEFITIEMAFHAKALEVYTNAYQHIKDIDEDEDLEVFRSSLHPPEYLSRLGIVRANSKSSFDKSGSTKPMPGSFQLSVLQNQQTPNNRRKNQLEDEVDDEEEDGDDDDDDDEH